MTVVSTKPEISHKSAFGTLVLKRQAGSIHHYQGKAFLSPNHKAE